jgi:chitin disaccharide deacetylase
MLEHRRSATSEVPTQLHTLGSNEPDTIKRVIVTADDFGQSAENNAGVLAAHLAGAITTASLMVGAPCFEEAVAIAQRNPALAVGLHVCLSEGLPLSPPFDIPLLVGSDGRFPSNERKLHVAVLSSEGRRQVRTEIMAQFHKYFSTDLACDHVDVHRNSHMHPLVANEVFRSAALWQVRTVRIPYDPPIERSTRLADPLRSARIAILRWLAAYHGLRWTDHAIGRDWSNPARLAALISALPPGTTELFFHPVVSDHDHPFKADLLTLLDDRVQQAFRALQTSASARDRDPTPPASRNFCDLT